MRRAASIAMAFALAAACAFAPARARALSSLAEGPGNDSQAPARLVIDLPVRVNPKISVTITVSAVDGAGGLLMDYAGAGALHGAAFSPKGGEAAPVPIVFKSGQAVLRRVFVREGILRAEAGGAAGEVEVALQRIPPVLSLAPPLMAIVLALVTRHVVLSLFCGIWLGATFLSGMNPLFGFMRSLDEYFRRGLGNQDHAAIIIFSLCLGGMVGIIARSGGLHAIASRMARWASTARNGQIATWLMGVAIFFDDYANTLLVGNTMRPFTDRLRISREKLAFVVDATAAPVASMAAVSTWVGYEIGLIQDSWSPLGLPGSDNIYGVFIRTIPYRFYAIILLFMVFTVALSGRDLGAMYRAERRSRLEGKPLRDGAVPMSDRELAEMRPPEGAPLRWINAALPIGVVIAAVVVGLYYSGSIALGENAASAGLMRILGAADSLSVLLWASAAGSVTAGILAVSQRVLNISQTMDAWLAGVKAMIVAMVVLVCAWALGAVCADLFTAGYVVDRVSGFITLALLPTAVFITAAAISFATGTSWGTMAILMPVVIPLGYHLSPAGEPPAGPMLAAVAAVLSGSCFGDHASPISDTTILSSMAASCDHVDHVRTQLPYALLAAGLGIATGYLPAGFGFHPALSIAVGLAAMVAFVMFFGKKVAGREGQEA
jgi:Na+/H+ antiporter NhaC